MTPREAAALRSGLARLPEVLSHDEIDGLADGRDLLGLLVGDLHPEVVLERHQQLDDPQRVRLLARRFAPDPCVPLEQGARIDWDGTGWSPVDAPAQRLDPETGTLLEVHA